MSPRTSEVPIYGILPLLSVPSCGSFVGEHLTRYSGTVLQRATGNHLPSQAMMRSTACYCSRMKGGGPVVCGIACGGIENVSAFLRALLVF